MCAHRLWVTAGVVAVTMLSPNLSISAPPKEPPKDLDKIPKTVMETLKAKFPNAKIEKWTKETEDGKVIYDIEFKNDGKKAEIDIFEDGSIQNFEKEFDATELPKAVIETVEKKFPKAKMKEVMEITEVKEKK